MTPSSETTLSSQNLGIQENTGFGFRSHLFPLHADTGEGEGEDTVSPRPTLCCLLRAEHLAFQPRWKGSAM